MYTILITSNPTKISAIPRIPFSLLWHWLPPICSLRQPRIFFPLQIIFVFFIVFLESTCQQQQTPLYRASQKHTVCAPFCLTSQSLRLSLMTMLIVYFVGNSFLLFFLIVVNDTKLNVAISNHSSVSTSVALIIFPLLCNHHLYFQSFFITPNKFYSF